MDPSSERRQEEPAAPAGTAPAEAPAEPVPVGPAPAPAAPAAPAEPVTAAPVLGLAPADTVGPALAGMKEELAQTRAALAATQERLAQMDARVEGLQGQLSFLPPQVRMLAGKVDGLATTISEPRYRSVLLSVLGVYDLVDQVVRSLPDAPAEGAEAEHRRNYHVLRTQLRQILEVNGLSEIPAEGAFDPQVHRAMQRVPCGEPEQAGRILSVMRPGFRTESAVLRYAEVTVGHYAPPAPAEQPTTAAPDLDPGAENERS